MLSPAFAVPALLLVVVLSALDARADARPRPAARHGQFGVRACALVSQAAFDADMTRGWYVDAARLLRRCGRVMAARAPRARRGGHARSVRLSIMQDIGGWAGRVFDAKTIIALALIGCADTWPPFASWTSPRGPSCARP